MKQYPITLVDGKPCSSLSVLDRGLAFGDGLFETMLVQSDQVVLWQYHRERLALGLQRLSINVQEKALALHMDATLSAISSVLTSNNVPLLEYGVLKLMVTRGYTEGTRGYAPTEDGEATLLSVFSPVTHDVFLKNQRYARNGVAVHYCEQKLPLNPALAGIKSLNQLNYVLASAERQALAVQEGLLFDSNDLLIEATARNLFIVKGGEVFTPPLNECGVAGVMRKIIIEHLLPSLGIKITEIKLSRKNLLLANEVFLSNSITGIWPVIQCEEKYWPRGNITQKIQAAAEHFFQKFD